MKEKKEKEENKIKERLIMRGDIIRLVEALREHSKLTQAKHSKEKL